MLLSLHHPNIVDVSEVVVDRTPDSVFMVMEFMDHELKALMEKKERPFSTSEVRSCLQAACSAVVEHTCVWECPMSRAEA